MGLPGGVCAVFSFYACLLCWPDAYQVGRLQPSHFGSLQHGISLTTTQMLTGLTCAAGTTTGSMTTTLYMRIRTMRRTQAQVQLKMPGTPQSSIMMTTQKTLSCTRSSGVRVHASSTEAAAGALSPATGAATHRQMLAVAGQQSVARRGQQLTGQHTSMGGKCWCVLMCAWSVAAAAAPWCQAT